MRKYTLNRDLKNLEPTEEQISRNKDFKKLSHRYEQLTKRPKKPLYQNPKFFLYLIIIILLAYIILFMK